VRLELELERYGGGASEPEIMAFQGGTRGIRALTPVRSSQFTGPDTEYYRMVLIPARVASGSTARMVVFYTLRWPPVPHGSVGRRSAGRGTWFVSHRSALIGCTAS